jgi:hypothetical protein
MHSPSSFRTARATVALGGLKDGKYGELGEREEGGGGGEEHGWTSVAPAATTGLHY